jgi:hypothetical protein
VLICILFCQNLVFEEETDSIATAFISIFIIVISSFAFILSGFRTICAIMHSKLVIPKIACASLSELTVQELLVIHSLDKLEANRNIEMNGNDILNIGEKEAQALLNLLRDEEAELQLKKEVSKLNAEWDAKLEGVFKMIDAGEFIGKENAKLKKLIATKSSVGDGY